MNPRHAERQVIDLSRPAAPDWRAMVHRIDTLTIAECSFVLGELRVAIGRMQQALTQHRESGTEKWRRRAEAALMHRQRDARSVTGRLLDIITERMATAPCEETRAACFMAAAVAILPVDQLAEVWGAISSDPDIGREPSGLEYRGG